LLELSPKAKIYIFVNKIDKLLDNQKNPVFSKIKEIFEKVEIKDNSKAIYLPTSIFDISLYKAMSNIYSDLIPKMDKIKELLKKLVTASWADEAVLLEKNTLIKICSFNEKEFKDYERFEKISELIKKFKNTCRLGSISFKDIFIKTINNIIYIDEFENSTYIIIAFQNLKTTLELVKINIEICKKTFKEIIEDE
jgi:Ras-related GTP-binding protein A/B